MISIFCKAETNTYNAYHLVKAFFPDEDAEVIRNENLETDVIVKDEEKILVAADAKDKLELERKIYGQLKSLTGNELPWGVLTGVRPTKLATMNIDKMDAESFAGWLGTERLVSREKAKLCYEIALREKKIIEAAGSGFSLYINVPVCPTKCTYCSFASGLLKDFAPYLDDYVAAVIKELDGISLETNPTAVYIGGGTPTVLSAGQLKKLLSAVNNRFSGFKEFTVEAGRPDTVDIEKLKVLKENGVTRISINPQTMQQKTLDLIRRSHKVSDVCDAFYMARDAGFDNINMDVIAGLPEETEDDMRDTLDKIKSLGPESLTVHSLSIKRKAALEKQSAAGSVVEEMIRLGALAARDMDMNPYYLYRQKGIAGNFENIGYAKEGKEGIYNILIMEEAQTIIGVGAGASTKILLDEPVPDPKRGGRHMTRILHKSNEVDIRRYIQKYS